MDKTFLGSRIETLLPGIESLPINRVEILDDNGDVLAKAQSSSIANGKTLSIVNPDGTKAMAEFILSKTEGYIQRSYEGRNALLDPAVELGDAVTVGGIYSVIAEQNLQFDALYRADISAPAADEIDDEYPYKSPTQRLIERNMAKTRSLITKTSEAIMLKVEGIDGKYTEVKTTLDGLTVTDQSGTTRIKGSSIETESIAANSISADKLNLTGQIAFSDLDAATQSSIYNANSNASSAIDAVSAWRYSGSTYIDGSKIMTGTVMATKLLGGTVGLLASDESVVGALSLAYTTTGIGLGILTSQGGIQIQSAGNVFLASGDGAFITLSNVVSLGGAPLVLSSKMYGNTLPSSPVQGTLYFLRKNT